MNYYNRSNEAFELPRGRAFWAIMIAVVLVGGFMIRGAMQSPLSEPVQDIDITGEWIGIVTEDYAGEVRYEYRLNFVQAEDGTVNGHMHVQSTNYIETIVADSMVVGSINDDDLIYQETQLTYLSGVPTSSWCRINVTLDHEVINGQETLTGTWVGIETPGVGSCAGIDGRVILTREN